MSSSQQPATSNKSHEGDAAIQISAIQKKASNPQKGGRPRKPVREGGISIEQFLKLFH